MTVNYTTNLALGQPVTGTESGTWGDDVNNSVTSYLDIAIAGGLSVTITTTDVTLTLTQGTSSATNIGSTTAQYAILNVSGAMTAARNLILPSSSRVYVINNNTTGGFALTVKGSATSGVTMVNGEKAQVFWTGSDYAKVGSTAGAATFTNLTYTGTLTGSTGVIAIGTNQIYKDSSGNVGIGTSSPLSKFEVNTGYITAGTDITTQGAKLLGAYYGANGHLATFGTEYSNGGPILGYAVWPSTTATGSFISATSTGPLTRGAYTLLGNSHIWYGGGSQTVTAGSAVTTTELMRIDSSGNLLVAQTSGGFNSRQVINFSGSGTSVIGITVFGSVAGAGQTFVQFVNNSSSVIGSITQSGTSAVLYNVTSDQRLKENIQDAESASDLIDALQVRQFDWKKDNTHQRYGFIAQELVTVAPEAVHQPVNEEEMMAVDYSKLVPMLVKAHQEQQALITSLTARIEALEAT